MSGNDELAAVLSDFARTMVTESPIQGILDHLVERIAAILPVDAAGVTLISPDAAPRYIAASSESALRYEMLQTELGEGPCLAAYQTGGAVAVPDLRKGARFARFSPRALEAGLAAVFTFPLRHDGRRLGALDLYRDTPGKLSAKSLIMAQTLADVAAAYLLNAQARADIQDASDRSRQDALHDALTGLPNRVLMLDRVEHALRRGSPESTAVVLVNLDRFKAINDTYGHSVGDEVLTVVAQRLARRTRPGDSLGRLFGDEFVIVCEDLDQSQAAVMAARVVDALAVPLSVSGLEVSVTARVVVAYDDADHHSGERLLQDASLAMYRVKRQAGHADQTIDLRYQHLVEHQAGLGRDLHGAVGRGELNLEYQPIVSTPDGQITGVEALLRWTHPSRGLVAPNVLIPLAEQSGLINEIGQWVLDQAWSDRNRWRSQHQGDQLTMSVNVSAHQLMTSGFTNNVAAALDRAGTDAQLLTLEVTESVFLRDRDRALIVLNDLKDLGVKVALDDFGTGYSSLSYLMKFPVDTVKIDRAFVTDLGVDPVSHTVVAAIIDLAHGLGMTVTAEGVETAEQHHHLAQLGCDACQGYYFARPMPALSFDSLLQGPAGTTRQHLPKIVPLPVRPHHSGLPPTSGVPAA
jgi:diguanylate cyclase (GGDEF)-like protein